MINKIILMKFIKGYKSMSEEEQKANVFKLLNVIEAELVNLDTKLLLTNGTKSVDLVI